jgi:hypothetical protein
MDPPDVDVVVMPLLWDSDGGAASLAAPAPAPLPVTPAPATLQQPQVNEDLPASYPDPDLEHAAALERHHDDAEAGQDSDGGAASLAAPAGPLLVTPPTPLHLSVNEPNENDLDRALALERRLDDAEAEMVRRVQGEATGCRERALEE